MKRVNEGSRTLWRQARLKLQRANCGEIAARKTAARCTPRLLNLAHALYDERRFHTLPAPTKDRR